MEGSLRRDSQSSKEVLPSVLCLRLETSTQKKPRDTRDVEPWESIYSFVD